MVESGMCSFLNVDQQRTSPKLPCSINTLWTLQLAMVALTTTWSSYLGSLMEKSSSQTKLWAAGSTVVSDLPSWCS